MTRRDFELIARTVRDTNYGRPPAEQRAAAEAWARALATTNPRFDEARFVTACGVQA